MLAIELTTITAVSRMRLRAALANQNINHAAGREPTPFQKFTLVSKKAGCPQLGTPSLSYSSLPE
jgi:hypothetical protein